MYLWAFLSECKNSSSHQPFRDQTWIFTSSKSEFSHRKTLPEIRLSNSFMGCTMHGLLCLHVYPRIILTWDSTGNFNQYCHYELWKCLKWVLPPSCGLSGHFACIYHWHVQTIKSQLMLTSKVTASCIGDRWCLLILPHSAEYIPAMSNVSLTYQRTVGTPLPS